MSNDKFMSIMFLLCGIAFTVVGVIFLIKDHPSAIWSYTVGLHFLNKAEVRVVMDRISKEEK